MWFHRFEQFTYYLAYSIKVSRTESPLHYSIQRSITELAGIRLRIHLFHRRSKSISRSTSLEQFTIGIQCARILNKIIFIIKLGRVHKNTYHRYFILVYTTLYKRCVPCMQSTHSRHQPHLFTLGFQNRKFSLQVLDRMYYFHFNWFMILSCLKNGAK